MPEVAPFYERKNGTSFGAAVEVRGNQFQNGEGASGKNVFPGYVRSIFPAHLFENNFGLNDVVGAKVRLELG